MVSYPELTRWYRDRTWSNNFKTNKLRLQTLLSQGYLPTTQYTDNLQQVVSSAQCHLYGRLYSDPRSTFDWWFVPVQNRASVTTDDATLGGMVAPALEKLQTKVSGEGANLPVTLVEVESTVKMLYGAAQKLLISWSHVRRGEYLRAAQALGLNRVPRRVTPRRTAEENWLEYRYGWRLVVMDMESYMKTIWLLLRDKPIVHRASVKAEKLSAGAGYPLSYRIPLSPDGWTNLASVQENVDLEFYRRVDVGYIYQLESVALSGSQSLGLLNLATVAWEIIPASFVADWALNVGSVLEGLTAFQGKKFLDGWVCKTIESRRTVTWSNPLRDAAYSVVLGGIAPKSFPKQIERRFVRNALGGFVHSSLRLEFDMSISRTLDLLSLIDQVFGRGRRR
jgi:hypothetical protein